MRYQFYFFGLAYLCKSVTFAVETYIWTESKWFDVLLINAILLILCDVIPVIYIACVHNHTFKEMQYSRLHQDL